MIYGASNPHNGDKEAAVNCFAFAEGNVNYLSRANGFANYTAATAAPVDFTLHGAVYANGSYDPMEHNDPNDEMPVTGANHGLQLIDLRGAAYDDPRWEQLLDQVTIDRGEYVS